MATEDLCGAPPPLAHALLLERPLPHWWLAVLGLYGLCNAAAVTLFDLVLFPDRVAELVGDDRKHFTLGWLTTMYTGLHFSLPVFGVSPCA